MHYLFWVVPSFFHLNHHTLKKNNGKFSFEWWIWHDPLHKDILFFSFLFFFCFKNDWCQQQQLNGRIVWITNKQKICSIPLYALVSRCNECYIRFCYSFLQNINHGIQKNVVYAALSMKKSIFIRELGRKCWSFSSKITKETTDQSDV